MWAYILIHAAIAYFFLSTFVGPIIYAYKLGKILRAIISPRDAGHAVYRINTVHVLRLKRTL